MDLLIAANTVTQPNSDLAPDTGTPGWATDGDPTTNTLATQAPAWHYNMMMAEMLAIVKAAGITPSNADWSQVLKAMQTIFAPAQRGVAPYSATLAQLIGGYPKYAIVVDAAGVLWQSSADANMTVPGADGATWGLLFDGLATEEWAVDTFLAKAGSPQTSSSPTTFTNGLRAATLAAPVGTDDIKLISGLRMAGEVLYCNSLQVDGDTVRDIGGKTQVEDEWNFSNRPTVGGVSAALLGDVASHLSVPGTASPWMQMTPASYNAADGVNGTLVTLGTAYPAKCVHAWGNDVGGGVCSYGVSIVDQGHVRIWGKLGTDYKTGGINLYTIGY